MSSTNSAKLKFYDENGTWSERRPASTNSNFTLKNITVCNTDFRHLSMSETDVFIELLSQNAPAIAVLENLSPAALTRIKGSSITRKMYAILENSSATTQSENTMALLRLGLPCEPSETAVKPHFQFIIRPGGAAAGGPAVTVAIVHAEPADGTAVRRNLLNDALAQHPAADAFLLITNLLENVPSDVEDNFREQRANAGFADLMEDTTERPIRTAWSMWLRSAKYAVTGQPTTQLMHEHEPRFLAAALAPRAGGAAGASSTIAIPMPRSAKSATTQSTKSPSSMPVSNQALSDPAVLSAEAARTNPAATQAPAVESDIMARLMRRQSRWKPSRCFALKGNDAKLSTAELAYDMSSIFASPSEAVEELNNRGITWPADFCVVHSTVLCNESVSVCDRQSFRRYVRDNKTNSSLHAQLTAAMTAFSNAHAVDKGLWGKPSHEVDELAQLQRIMKREEAPRREWSEANCTIVYQITPRDMKFNITNDVGLTKDALKKAIYWLNRAGGKQASKETNPLYDYHYDYALLFTPERQGFWLIAANHVPCDIVACRTVQ